eukprot:scaffold22373_cov78-Cyclotella_meneghiniana.AAC.8
MVIDLYGGVIDNANTTAGHGDIRERVGWIWGGWGALFIWRLPAMASGLECGVVGGVSCGRLWAMMCALSSHHSKIIVHPTDTLARVLCNTSVIDVTGEAVT